jgi:hypothetical protein
MLLLCTYTPYSKFPEPILLLCTYIPELVLGFPFELENIVDVCSHGEVELDTIVYYIIIKSDA